MSTLLTAEQVAQRAQVSVKLIYKLAASGALPAVRYGTAVRFRPESIEAWEAAQLDTAL